MSIYDAVSQYTKLAEQFSSNSGGGGLFNIAKSLLGGSSGDLVQKFFGALSPDIIQKLSALKSLGGGEAGSVDSADSFLSSFSQLTSKFAGQDTGEQITKLSNLADAGLITKGLDLAKQFGVNLDDFKIG